MRRAQNIKQSKNHTHATASKVHTKPAANPELVAPLRTHPQIEFLAIVGSLFVSAFVSDQTLDHKERFNGAPKQGWRP